MFRLGGLWLCGLWLCPVADCPLVQHRQRSNVTKKAEFFVFSFTAGSWYHYIIEYKLIIMLYWYYPQCGSWWFLYQRSAPLPTYFYLHHVIQLVPFGRSPGNFLPLAVSLWHITDKGAYNRFFLYTAKGMWCFWCLYGKRKLAHKVDSFYKQQKREMPLM